MSAICNDVTFVRVAQHEAATCDKALLFMLGRNGKSVSDVFAFLVGLCLLQLRHVPVNIMCEVVVTAFFPSQLMQFVIDAKFKQI